MDKSKQPGINFEAVFLTEVNFWRTPTLPKDVKTSVSFSSSISNQPNGVKANAVKTVLVGTDSDENKCFELNLTLVGLFSVQNSDKNMELDEFIAKYSTAHLMPFIRQQIAQITLNAGMPTIYLSPMNIDAMMSNQNVYVEQANEE